LRKKRICEATIELDIPADRTIDAEYRVAGLVRGRGSLNIP
jgi:hypothetical protein